ncbi:MAG: Ger(x)C family spore germination protein [Firmicutes bacterium]|nr:Ger(x)C family spore germination protein [Bacillota bacterium]MDY5335995.1 Ger(x)C family spore germination protein [Bacilli bacterium]
MKRIKFLILLLPLLSGCYNYRELNDLGITTAVSIDYKDNNFYVIAEVINPIKQQDASSSNNSPFVNYNSSSSSLQDAFRKVVLESPRQLYAAQLEIIVLSEEVVNNHLEEVLEYFARDPEARTEIKIIVAKTEDSTKAITLQTLLTSLSSSNIINSLDLQSKVLGMSYPVTLNELLNMYIDPYLEVVLPSMTLYGNYEIGDEKENITTSSPKAIVKIDGSTITKDNKILGYLDLEESKILNLINGKLKETIIKMNYYDGYIIFEPNRIKVSRELDIKNNIIKINISGYSKTKEIQSNINVKDPKEVEKLNKALNMELEKKITDTFNSIREKYGTDVFGFQELYYRTNYKYFKENCTNWYEDIYPKIKLEVKANVRLYEKGSTLGGLRYERKNK